MSRRILAYCAAAGLVAVAAVALAVASVGARPASRLASVCHLTVAKVARGQGAPDDLAWDGSKLLVSDIKHGTIGIVGHGRVKTLIGQIREPEGMVPRPPHDLVVVEQATNRLLLVNVERRSRSTIVKLALPPHKSGVDNIEAASGGAMYVPDSAGGRLYLLRAKRLKLLAAGMIRPVSAVGWRHGIAVADEYANAIWMIRGRKRTRLANLTLPDDLAVVANHLVAVSLAGGVWEVAPRLRMLSASFRDPQGLVADGHHAVLVADQTTNAIYRVAGLSACLP